MFLLQFSPGEESLAFIWIAYNPNGTRTIPNQSG
jgi:hypothetical protein